MIRFTYAESMTDPANYVPLAQAAEEAGYDSFLVPDSIAYPRESDSRYPFNPDGSREFLEGKPFLDPFQLVAVLGTVTERIRFTTSVIKLPNCPTAASTSSTLFAEPSMISCANSSASPSAIRSKISFPRRVTKKSSAPAINVNFFVMPD